MKTTITALIFALFFTGPAVADTQLLEEALQTLNRAENKLVKAQQKLNQAQYDVQDARQLIRDSLRSAPQPAVTCALTKTTRGRDHMEASGDTEAEARRNLMRVCIDHGYKPNVCELDIRHSARCF